MIDAEIKKLTMGALRRQFIRSKQRRSAQVKARIGRGLYICNKCQQIGGNIDMQVDHIEPVMKDQIWENILTRFWSEDNLQYLCKPCHKEKTKIDMENMRGNND